MARKPKSELISCKKRTTDSVTDKKNSSKKLKKSLLGNTPNSGDIDSLKNVKGKSLKDIDKKIKNLKSELQSLVESSPKTDSENSSFEVSNNDNTCSFECEKGFLNNSVDGNLNKTRKSKQIEEINSSELLSSPGPSFSNHLTSPWDDEIDVGVDEPSAKKLNPYHDKNSRSILSNKLLTAHKDAEKLLYKSFVLQNLQKYSSSSEESEIELSKATRKNMNKGKSKRKPLKNTKTKSVQKKTSRKTCSKRGRKRKVEYESESDVEVIDLEPSSLRRSTRNKNVEVDFHEIESLDWDEPFHLDENADAFSSDLEIIETPNEKSVAPLKRKKMSSCLEKDKNHSLSSEKGERKSWECPICFEHSIGQEIVTTLCGHVFCKKCIEKCDSSKKRTCPSCRSDITNKPLITLFNF